LIVRCKEVFSQFATDNDLLN